MIYRKMNCLTFYRMLLKCSKILCTKNRMNINHSLCASTDQQLIFPDTNLMKSTVKLNEGPSLRSKQNKHFIVEDPVSADFIASKLCENWNEGYIFELNPGPGVLTKALLRNGVQHLRVFEKNEEHLQLLKELTTFHPNLEIIEEDFLFLPSLESKSSINYPQVLDSFFDGIPDYSWNEKSPFRIFSIISNRKSVTFLRFLLAVLPNRLSIFSHGRCELFLLLSETEYVYMKAEPKENYSTYRWSTVLYNLFFEIKYLETFIREICEIFPPMKRKIKVEGHHLHFVKLTPKVNLFTSVVNGNKVSEFYFFIRHHLAKRTGLVIPAMEGWIPSCGPRLIREGMNVFTKFGDLSPNQLLELFNQFSSWPEYEDSVFLAAMQRFYGKGSLFDDEDEMVDR